MKTALKILSLVILFTLAACSQGAYENIHDSVGVTLRNHSALAINPSFTKIAIMPFRNTTDQKNAAKFARRSFYGNLVSYRNWNVQPIAETDKRLAAATRRDAEEGNATAVGNLLGVDLVCYGEVTEQVSRYGLVYSYNSVTARIAMYNAQTGEKVWEAQDFRDSLVMGISFMYMYERDFMWAREIHNRYDELFRDMVQQFPLCTYGYKK